MFTRTEAVMGTLVSIRVVASGEEVDFAVERAFDWFQEIEERCSRFDPDSELMQLCGKPGKPVVASSILYEAVGFALTVAEETGGAFDPTVGYRMERRGFNKEHRSGETVRSAYAAADDASYRDVELDPRRQTITLHRPLTLDLGAVAKGLAVDAAVRELKPFRDFSIDAGGDLYLGGRNAAGELWSVGIRHPRRDKELIDTLRVSNQAVCTSGDYEKRSPDGGHHILDPRAATSARAVASATVVAPIAMLADALATAVFVMGPKDGLRLLAEMEVEGLVITPELERFETRGLRRAA